MPTESVPAYRKREDRDQAIVTLTDKKTKVRRDYYLGPYDSAESRQLYFRLLAEWESSDRTLPAHPDEESRRRENQFTVSELALAYWKHCDSYYRSQESQCIKVVLRLLTQFFGEIPAADFGPKRLRFLRDQMIRGDQKAAPPREAWSRKYINHQVKRICRMFKWASGQEMLPVTVYQQLATVEGLKRGRSEARENAAVKPVSMDRVDAIRPYVSRQVEALIDLQLLTGARGGELFKLRRVDLQVDERSGLWTYAPLEHKNAYREKPRTIIFGPRAQDIIKQFFEERPITAYLFSAAEADTERRAKLHAARKTPMSCGNIPGSNRKGAPQRKPGDHYTRASYLYAIYHACDRAFPPPEHLQPGMTEDSKRESKAAMLKRLTPAQRSDLQAWRSSHRWHPHQLRHVAGTELRRKFGLEVAQIVLGHSSAQITDAVYAERDMGKLLEVMKQVG
jgi:integrase